MAVSAFDFGLRGFRKPSRKCFRDFDGLWDAAQAFRPSEGRECFLCSLSRPCLVSFEPLPEDSGLSSAGEFGREGGFRTQPSIGGSPASFLVSPSVQRLDLASPPSALLVFFSRALRRCFTTTDVSLPSPRFTLLGVGGCERVFLRVGFQRELSSGADLK